MDQEHGGTLVERMHELARATNPTGRHTPHRLDLDHVKDGVDAHIVAIRIALHGKRL